VTVPEPEPRTPEWWDDRYLRSDTPWDTGIVPPEVRAAVASAALAPGWALDLGCGSGLNARYLAAHGYHVVGIDLALSALARGNRAARAAGVPAFFCLADVTRPPLVPLRAVFALDIGCFHALPIENRPAYIEALAGRLAPGADYLLYAFELWADDEGLLAGVGPADIAAFAPCFALRSASHGSDRSRPAAWYSFRRF